MKKISRESGAAILIGIAVIGANSWHVLTEWVKNAPQELFTGVAHYFADYFLYVSFIRQGSQGAWIWTENLFTNEAVTPTWIYWIYTLIGKSGLLGVNPFAAYNGSLMLFAALLLFIWWHIIRRVIPKQPIPQIIAFLLLTTASQFSDIAPFWFSPTPALNRLGGVPHQIFQTILLLSVILRLSALIEKKRSIFPRSSIIHYSLFIILVFLAATANPIQMLLLVIAGGITYLWNARFRFPIPPHVLLVALSLSLPALLGAYITNVEFARQPVLTAAKIWENAQFISVNLWQFILALGPIAILIPFGIRKVVSQPLFLPRLLMVFTVLSIAAFLSPLPKALGTTPVRWLSPASYGMLPIIGAIGCIEISRVLHLISGKRIPLLITRCSVLVIYVLFTIPSLLAQIESRIEPVRNDGTIRALNHVSRDVTTTLEGLRDAHAPGVVLTDPVLPYDILVPVATDKRTFTGHMLHTLYPQTKEELRRRFFEGSMSNSDARQFLSDHRITYILASPGASRTLPQYTFMKQLVQNEFIVLYEAD